jgi:hypothetical protein
MECCLVAALLWYINLFKKDLEGKGYLFNALQHTVQFHVDSLMCSHMNPKVNDDFEKWLNEM